jgi:DNA-directed RNA polymerase specialized sigma24 family protein
MLDDDLGSPNMNKPAAATPPRVHKLAQRLTAETMQALRDAYRAGASLGELQQRFGLSRGSVQRLLRERGLRRRRKNLTDEKVAVIVRRYDEGLTIREIAAEQRLPKTTVQDALARTEVAMRPPARRGSGTHQTHLS